MYGVIFNFGTKEHIYAFLESTKTSIFNSDNLFMILIAFQNLSKEAEEREKRFFLFRAVQVALFDAVQLISFKACLTLTSILL